jgi:hypothetical protein
VKSWLEPGSNLLYQPIDTKLITAIQQQEAIGWRHFMRGRLSLMWGEIINDHLSSSNIKNMSAETWGSQLVQLNWKYILLLWNQRNKELHGSTKEEQDKIRHHLLINELRHIQDEHKDMPNAQKRLVGLPEAHMVSITTNNLASYLKGARILAKHNKKQRTANLRYLRITNFFKPRTRSKPEQDPKEDKSELDPGEP